MKLRLKKFTIAQYVQYMRRQSKHIQHLHALAFAGSITFIIAGFILYTDYGFWHERYNRVPDTIVVEEQSVSIGQSWRSFFLEAKTNFSAIGTTGSGLLEGKETFTR